MILLQNHITRNFMCCVDVFIVWKTSDPGSSMKTLETAYLKVCEMYTFYTLCNIYNKYNTYTLYYKNNKWSLEINWFRKAVIFRTILIGKGQ